MTVYVDTMRALKRYGSKGYVFSHMFVGLDDDRAELHAMAARIGVQRKWYQGPPGHLAPFDHYDIVQAKKRMALDAGAVEVVYGHQAGETGDLMYRWTQMLYQRAISLATVLGHDVNPAPGKMGCRRCGRVALTRSMTYGTATDTGCDPVRLPGHELPPGHDPATAVRSHAGHARLLTTPACVRVGVTGGRHYGHRQHVRRVLEDALARYGAILVVHGDNESPDGADFFAREWAEEKKAAGFPVDHEPHPADWMAPCWAECYHQPRTPGECCPAQGNYRNQEMVDLGAAEWHAFFQPGRVNKGGTGDCAGRAEAAGIRVHRYVDGRALIVQPELPGFS